LLHKLTDITAIKAMPRVVKASEWEH
jgi:hypothetical protein